ncbi:hypothetical protein ACFX11_038409 [Malus domestica]
MMNATPYLQGFGPKNGDEDRAPRRQSSRLNATAGGDPPPQSTRTVLPFTGDYPALGAYARCTAQPSASGARNPGSCIHENIPMLEQIPLGRNELDNAITKLHYAASHSDQAAAFIVIIQMVSEAARFRYIESQVGTRMRIDNPPYIPDPAMRSLETNWSALSEQIQKVPANGKRFNRPIQLTTVNNRAFVVDSVEADMVQRRGIAMLLYARQVPTLDRQCNETAGHRHVHDEL